METFSSFSYLVRNDFIYKDKVEVRVFFIYLDKGVANKSLFLDKIHNKPERLYIADAKKIINKMIENGSLEKYAKENIKHTKNKKAGIAFATVMVSALVIGGIATGAYFLLRVPTYGVSIPSINGLTIDVKKIKSGTALEASLMVNSELTNEILPVDLTSVKVGKEECEYTYTPNNDYINAKIVIDGSFIRNNVTIDLSLRECPWYLDKEYIKGLKKDDINNGDGVIKTIEVNGQQHKVRLIGVDEDVDVNGNPVHTTWEFANFISDHEGRALATQWHDAKDTVNSNNDYLNSTIRKALNGTGGASHFLWAEMHEEYWSKRYFEPVIDMLPKDLVNTLIAPKKQCLYRNVDTGDWETRIIESEPGVYDKLFLLSPTEMGGSDIASSHTYTYYLSTIKTDPKRFKKHVNEDLHSVWAPDIKKGQGQECEGSVTNYAGWMASSTSVRPGYYFLRTASPSSYDFASSMCVANGCIETSSTSYNALNIAPAFCL